MKANDIRLEEYLRTLVPAVIAGFQDPNKQALYLQFDLSSHFWDTEQNAQTASCAKVFHVLIRMPNGMPSGQVNVFTWMSEFYNPTSPSYLNFSWDNFINISNHDSCWKESIAGEMEKVRILMRNEMQKQTKNPELSIYDEHFSNNLHLSYIHQIEVTLEKNIPSDKQLERQGYDLRWKIAAGKAIQDLLFPSPRS